MGEDRTSSRIKAGRRRQSLPRRCSVTRHYAKLFGVPSFSPSNLYSSESCTEGCHSKQQKSADIFSWTMGLVPWNVVVCLSSRLKAVLIHTEIIYIGRARGSSWMHRTWAPLRSIWGTTLRHLTFQWACRLTTGTSLLWTLRQAATQFHWILCHEPHLLAIIPSFALTPLDGRTTGWTWSLLPWIP